MKTAWFVDDDEEMARVIRMMLESLGFKTKTFSNARELAKALIDGGQPDILIVDIMMPQVSGIDLLKFVRSRDEWDPIPILMLSAVVSGEQVDEATALGADGYVFKPVTLDELEVVISMAREERRKINPKKNESGVK